MKQPIPHSLRLTKVAGGVQAGEQRRLLHLLACDEMPGGRSGTPCPGARNEAGYLR
jgi:hypothetical protein